MKKLGFVDKKKGWEFCRGLEEQMTREKWNRRFNNSGRKCIWLGIGVELGINSTAFKGLEIGEGLRRRCNQLWGGKEWNSILIYKYERGCE